MATKKKAPKKKPAARRPVARRRPATQRSAPKPVLAPQAPLIPEPASGSGGPLLGLLIITAVLILAWFFMGKRETTAPTAAPSAPSAAKDAAVAPPQARSIAPSAVKAEAKPAPAASAAAHRETAGAAKAKPSAPVAEKGAPSLTFDRSQGELSVRCWRSEGGTASLDVFAPKNRFVRSVKSEAGKAGMVELKWDGKDAAGKKVPEGLYFLRPTQKDEQSIRDVWVK